MNMTGNDQDNPGVITIPPLIYIAFFLIGLGLNYLWPVSVLPDRAQYAAGGLLIVVSAIIAGITIPKFRMAHTGFYAFKPTTSLITDGPFRFSRNPTYLALGLLYIGIGIALDCLWIIGMLIPLLAVMHYGVIRREERYLERKFGDEYLRYRASVRRWL